MVHATLKNTLYLCLMVLMGCSSSEDPVMPPVGPEPLTIPPPGPHLSVLPVPIETIGRITALGYNNKVLPVAHTYWETCESWVHMRLDRDCHEERQELKAPGSGIVLALLAADDGYITVEGPPGLQWTFGHVTPASGLTVGSSVTAGEVIARMFVPHGFDFGLVNPRVEHQYIVPEHYPIHGLHGEHPIAQYPASTRNELLTRMNPAGPNLGKLSYDQLGTISGTWVTEGTGPIILERGHDNLILFLGRWSERPESRIVTFGEFWDGMPNRTLLSDPAAPDWEQITVSSGMVSIKLWNLNADARQNFDWPGGTLLVQAIDDHSLQMEWINTHDPVSEFSSASQLYER